MKKKIVLLFALLSLFALLYKDQLKAYYIYQTNKNKVVIINTDKNNLSGFKITYNNQTYVVTCFHGVCDDECVKVNDKTLLLVEKDIYQDIALFKIEDNDFYDYDDVSNVVSNNIIAIGENNDIKSYKKGKIISRNEIIENTIIYNNEEYTYSLELIQLELDAKHGYSGSLVLDYFNHPIGMITMKDEHYVYAISFETILNFIESTIKEGVAND